MSVIVYTEDGIAWAYKPVIETDPEKIAEAERKFDELLKRLEDK